VPTPRLVLLRPHWIVAHVMVLTVVVTFPLLGRWQLQRWDEERVRQARIDARVDGDPVPLSEVLSPDTPADALAALEYQPVTVTGTWVPDEEVAHRNRDLDGQGGFDWLTPLELGDGTAVLVRRGFVPPDRPGGADPAPAPPTGGTVTVTGWLELSGRQPGFGPTDPDEGRLATVFHADVARLDEQTTDDLLPMVLHLRTQAPPIAGDLPVPQPVPEIDTSQNISYAVQWFVFTAIAIVGYGVVLWRKWGQRVGDEDPDEAARPASATRPRRPG
jgi:surfeit locus 1 family protein